MPEKAEFDGLSYAPDANLLPRSSILSIRKGINYQQIVVILLFFSTFINFLDRQTLSISAPLLRDQFGISNIGYSRIVFAFLLGYTISQTLVGKLIDRVGTRKGLLICVAAWSVAAMLHGLAAGFLSLCVARVLLGAAEAGNWPGAVKAISETVPSEQRSLAVGIFNSGAFIAAILAPPVVVGLVNVWGWRAMFAVVGLTGFVWILFWSRLYDRNSAHAPVALPMGDSSQTSILAYLREPAVWGVLIGRFLADPVWWFYAFWLPEYFARNRGLDLSAMGKVLWIPFLFAAVGSWFGGYASGALIRRGWPPVLTRKLVMGTGAGLMLLGIPAFLAATRFMAISWMCLVLFGYSTWAANLLSLPADLFPSNEVARVTGLCGTAGAIGGMLFTLATGWLVQHWSYGPVFSLASAMIVSAAVGVAWLVPQQRIASNT